MPLKRCWNEYRDELRLLLCTSSGTLFITVNLDIFGRIYDHGCGINGVVVGLYSAIWSGLMKAVMYTFSSSVIHYVEKGFGAENSSGVKRLI